MASENTHLSLFELDRIFKNAKSIFFVGIGGISMCSLAELCIRCGKEVFGYDRCHGEECRRLERVAHIRYCSTTDNVRGMDLVVFSNAIDRDCFELCTARSLGIPCVSRANFLAYVMSGHRIRIGVSGMHGKSTTTAMLTKIFSDAGRDPTSVCGAKMCDYDAPYRFGHSDFFIFEACEYMNSFLNFTPTDAVVTSIDFDHPDFFKDLSQVKSSFEQYILPAARAFVNADDEGSKGLTHPFKITFGIDNSADYMAKIDTGATKNAFYALKHGRVTAHIELKEFGRYNVYNALCAFAVACEHGIPPVVAARSLSSFEGLGRRQELLGHTCLGDKTSHRVPIFLDYAHHPTEIRASLSAFRDMGYKSILCIFQAHTYSRTYALYEDFTKAFGDVSEVISLPIYAAREKNTFPISDEGFARDIGAVFMSDYSEVAAFVKRSSADAVVIMGAGDIVGLKNYLI